MKGRMDFLSVGLNGAFWGLRPWTASGATWVARR